MGHKKRRNRGPEPIAKPVQSEAPQSHTVQKEAGVTDSRKKLCRALALVGGVVALSGAVYAVSQLSKKEFDPATYEPPKEGRVWKPHIVDAGKKTIVYIPDLHSQPDDPLTWAVQNEIFAIVEDGIKRYGQVPVVLEEWTDFGDVKYNYRRHISDNNLGALDSEPDQSKRREMAIRMINEGKGRAPSLLPVVYQNELIPVPSHDREQAKKSLADMSMFSSLATAREEKTPCDAFGVPAGGMNLEDAMRDVFSSHPSKQAVDCLCTYDGLFRDSQSTFALGRTKAAAAEEVRRAAEQSGPFTYIIAGSVHTEEAMRSMESRGLDYIVVAPQSNKMNTYELTHALDTPASLAVCDEWNKGHKNELNVVVQKYRKRFADHAKRTFDELDRKSPR